MSCLTRLVTITAIACTLLPSGLARADTHRLRCIQSEATGAPGTVELSCDQAPPEPAQPARPALGDQTHVFFLPTGNTLRAGEAAVRGHGLFLYDQLAYGLSDNIELTVGAPVIPIFASAGIRVQLLPRTSSLRLLVTAGLWKALADAEELTLISGSGTLAYQSGAINLHLTIGTMTPVRSETYADGDSNDTAFLLTSIGAVLRSGDRSALFIEVGQIMDDHEYNDSFNGAAAGVKLIRSSYNVDLGFLMALEDASAVPTVPFVSADFRF